MIKSFTSTCCSLYTSEQTLILKKKCSFDAVETGRCLELVQSGTVLIFLNMLADRLLNVLQSKIKSIVCKFVLTELSARDAFLLHYYLR